MANNDEANSVYAGMPGLISRLDDSSDDDYSDYDGSDDYDDDDSTEVPAFLPSLGNWNSDDSSSSDDDDYSNDDEDDSFYADMPPLTFGWDDSSSDDDLDYDGRDDESAIPHVLGTLLVKVSWFLVVRLFFPRCVKLTLVLLLLAARGTSRR